MENVIIAIAAVILVGIQAHRNYLMVQAAKRTTEHTSEVHVNVQPAEPAVDIKVEPLQRVDVAVEIDYAKLTLALAEAIQKGMPPQLPVVIPNPNPPYIPPSGPYWQTPIVSGEAVIEETTIQTASGVEVPIKKF